MLTKEDLRGGAGAPEPALLASGGRMPKRSQHGASGGQEGRSERPGDGERRPRAATMRAPQKTTPRTAFGRAGRAKKIPAIPTLALLALPSALEA